MTAEEYRALLDTDFSDVKLEEMPDMASYHTDMSDTIGKTAEVYQKSWKSLYDESGKDESKSKLCQ